MFDLVIHYEDGTAYTRTPVVPRRGDRVFLTERPLTGRAPMPATREFLVTSEASISIDETLPETSDRDYRENPENPEISVSLHATVIR